VARPDARAQGRGRGGDGRGDLAGQHGHVNYDAIPWVIYTAPEIAWVGKTEQQLKGEAWPTRPAASPSPTTAGARPRGAGRLHQDPRRRASDRILGVHAIGSLASELIAEAVGGDRVRRLLRGHRAHLPRASFDVRGDARGRRSGSKSAR
jgi:pyruvate/2-oxoglutarate dehydrogenase complex dihydrolipoamide dehydrogenase (E3) component